MLNQAGKILRRDSPQLRERKDCSRLQQSHRLSTGSISNLNTVISSNQTLIYRNLSVFDTYDANGPVAECCDVKLE
jgi:hypothetical protein